MTVKMGSTYYWGFSFFHYTLLFGGIFSPKYLGLGTFQISEFFQIMGMMIQTLTGCHL